jgi:hypothetical protein
MGSGSFIDNDLATVACLHYGAAVSAEVRPEDKENYEPGMVSIRLLWRYAT